MQVFVSKLSLRFISIMRALRLELNYGSRGGGNHWGKSREDVENWKGIELVKGKNQGRNLRR
jgi:hypothetical protein